MLNSLQQGFLLTRQAYDSPNGLILNFWLKTSSGAVKIITDDLALFFIETDNKEKALNLLKNNHIKLKKHNDLPLKTFGQKLVTSLYFTSLKSFYLARDLLKEHQIKCYEDDIRPDDRYLMERFITADMLVAGHEINHRHYLEVNHAKCKQETSDIRLSVISLDIECSFDGELYSIGLYSDNYEKVLMIGEPQSTTVNYIEWLKDETALLEKFLTWLTEYDPDVIIGWNVINFDFSLLQKRCDIHGIDFSLGRDGSKAHWRKSRTSEQKFLEIAGRVVIDGIDLLKTATYNFASFSLENVAREMLGIGKKVDDVDNRVKEISHNFKYHKEKLAIYNLEDCRLVWLIFEKAQLIEFAMLRAQLTGLSIDRIGGSVAAFTNLYLPKLHRAGYIAPNMGDGRSDLVSPGGYVMDSIPGLYENVLVLDFKSLYPSIIRTFSIDPMGLIEGLKSPDKAIKGFDGAYFSREQHFLPDIIKSLWQERDKAKQDKNAALSQAIKIIMNSFYGVLGSTGCRFFDPRLSGSITKRSHEIIKTTKSWIEAKGYQVIYGDTDSIFVHIKEANDSQHCRLLGEQLQAFINSKWQHELTENYQIESQLEIEFETHFLKFLMPTVRGLDVGTKKRYAGLINKSGKQELVFKGLENVRTDWTQLAKDFQYELYFKVFNNEPVEDYVKATVAKVYAGDFDDKLIYRKRLRRKLSDYQKNVPPHVKAARHADEINKKQGKPLKYQKRGWIEYVMTVNGPQVKEYQSAHLDYQLYIDRQIVAVADAILPFINTSFAQITDKQLNLFS